MAWYLLTVSRSLVWPQIHCALCQSPSPPAFLQPACPHCRHPWLQPCRNALALGAVVRRLLLLLLHLSHHQQLHQQLPQGTLEDSETPPHHPPPRLSLRRKLATCSRC